MRGVASGLTACVIEDRHKSRGSTGREWAHAPPDLSAAHKSESVINEPRLNPITRRGGIFWLVAVHEVPFAGAAYTIAASLVIHFRR